MVKTPRTRHSRSEKEPVTIDLEPGSVSRVDENVETGTDASPGAESLSSTSETAMADASEEAIGTGKEADEGRTWTGDARAANDGDHGSAFGRTPEPQPAANVRGRSTAEIVSAGVAGGIVTLALAATLQFAGILPPGSPVSGPGQEAIAVLEAEIAELRQIITSLPAERGTDSAFAGRLGEAEQRLDALASEVERQRTAIAELPQGGEPAPEVDLGPIEARIAAVETAIAGLGQASPEAALEAVNSEIAAIRQQVGEVGNGQAALGQRLDALEGSVATLNQRMEEAAEAPVTAIIIAASALKAAIDRGQPFMNELETFAALAPDAPEIAELRDLAASGVPTRAQIAAESDAAANAMIAAARPIDPQSGIIDRLWASAQGLVQVRPIGMVEGEGVPEIVARLDAAVSAGDYERAIAEFGSLPDAAKTAGEAFMAKLRARHAADTLIDQALAAALRA